MQPDFLQATMNTRENFFAILFNVRIWRVFNPMMLRSASRRVAADVLAIAGVNRNTRTLPALVYGEKPMVFNCGAGDWIVWHNTYPMELLGKCSEEMKTYSGYSPDCGLGINPP